MTNAQLRAARQNAQHSTGPRTDEGKAASSRNAVRHNLSGTVFVLLPSEDPQAFRTLVQDYADEWKPDTPHEKFLVTQMVQSRWRLNRIARMEAEILDTVLNMPFAENKSDEAAIVISYPLMNEQMLDKLHRYANDAERAYNRAVKELRAYRTDQLKQSKNQQLPAAEPKTRNEPKPATAQGPATPVGPAATAPTAARQSPFAAFNQPLAAINHPLH